MSSTFGAGFGFLFALPVLIAQWIGVIGLAKGGRTPAWWCMMVGTVLSTLGSILSLIIMGLLVGNALRSGGMESMLYFFMAIGGVSGLGSLLFAVGFAIHGLTARKLRARVEELESVLTAQGEQLSRRGSVELS